LTLDGSTNERIRDVACRVEPLNELVNRLGRLLHVP
jgi:hypothetical protein